MKHVMPMTAIIMKADPTLVDGQITDILVYGISNPIVCLDKGKH